MAGSGIPDLNQLAMYVPPPFGVREHNLGDAWRAKFIEGADMPAGVPIDYAYALLYAEGKGYVLREAGTEAWGTIEGAGREGEKVEALIKRLAKEQANATLKKVVITGHLECRATSHNADHPVGTTVVRPFALALASKVGDMPSEGKYQRRRLPTNEHMVAIRLRYPEFEKYMADLSNTYFIMAAKGEA